jgi:hypothetical protein
MHFQFKIVPTILITFLLFLSLSFGSTFAQKPPPRPAGPRGPQVPPPPKPTKPEELSPKLRMVELNKAIIFFYDEHFSKR